MPSQTTDSALAVQLGAWAASLEEDALSDGLAAEAVNRVLDYLAVTIAAHDLPEAEVVRRFAGDWAPAAGERSSTVILQGHRVDAASAALLNGLQGHAKELDDEHHGMIGHPGVVVIPAALAVGESMGATGRQMLLAVALGYDVACRIGMSAHPGALHARGFHPTGACGVFGATTTASRLLGLSETQTMSALGIAGSMASSIFEFVADGSQTKRLHAGWSAHGGVMAAQLARSGLTGPKTVLEGRFGFFRSFAGDGRYSTDAVCADLGVDWEIAKTAYNPYSCCSYIYPCVDVVLDILDRYAVGAEEIESIHLEVPPAMVPIVAEPRDDKLRPKNKVVAQFSVYFFVAAAVLSGERRSDMTTFASCLERLDDQQALDLAQRIECVPSSALAATFPQQYPVRARVATRDGRSLAGEVTTHRGDPEEAGTRFDDRAIRQRFDVLTSGSPVEHRRSQIVDAVHALAEDGGGNGSIERLMDLLR